MENHHFVNLVSWKAHLRLEPGEYHIDSVSLQWLNYLYTGMWIGRVSGLAFINRLNLEECDIISAYNIDCADYVAPNLESYNDIKRYAEEILSVLSKDKLVLGISSPKQDSLARVLRKYGYEGQIYCLGAALYERNELINVDRLGLNWLYMLFKNPVRGTKKVIITILNIFKIVCNKNERNAFKNTMKVLFKESSLLQQ